MANTNLLAGGRPHDQSLLRHLTISWAAQTDANRQATLALCTYLLLELVVDSWFSSCISASGHPLSLQLVVYCQPLQFTISLTSGIQLGFLLFLSQSAALINYTNNFKIKFTFFLCCFCGQQTHYYTVRTRTPYTLTHTNAGLVNCKY